MAAKLKLGDSLPVFQLPSQSGDTISSESLMGQGPLVIYFYPKDNSPGCTAQACAIRDQYEEFTDAGAQVVGISSDSEESHVTFAKDHRLPFVLLSDRKGEAQRAFGVSKSLGFIPGRETFVFDKEGKLQHHFSSQIRATKHVAEALKVLKRLSS